MKIVPLSILCIALAACGGGPKEEEIAKKPIVAVKTAVAEGASVDLTLRAPATIFPRDQANITPRLTGVIREMKARKGDTVIAGALLVVLENRDLASQRDLGVRPVRDLAGKTRRGNPGGRGGAWPAGPRHP